jgi:hypothetical protein
LGWFGVIVNIISIPLCLFVFFGYDGIVDTVQTIVSEETSIEDRNKLSTLVKLMEEYEPVVKIVIAVAVVFCLIDFTCSIFLIKGTHQVL